MRIFLIGFMGSGKTTLGKPLAEALNIPFVDLDQAIEAAEGQSISAIFARQGEEYFRKVERQVLEKVVQANPTAVVATGGGAPCFGDTMDYLNRNGITLLLDVSPAELTRRLEAAASRRPLLQQGEEEDEDESPLPTGMLRKSIELRLAKRLPFYRKAQLEVRTDAAGVEDLLKKIRASVPR